MPSPRSSPRLLRHGPIFLAAFLSFFVSLGTLPAKAVEPDEVLQDQALEARARHISEGLRCLVCQNQSIDDSAAPLAKDLRLLVRERLKAGDTDQQIEDFVVARYGEFVLLKPRFNPHTLLLWLLPPLALAGGAVVIWLNGRRRSKATVLAEQDLSTGEKARLSALISEETSANKSA